MKKLILITGGARSGKSSFAVKLASELGSKVTFMATAGALDEEMKRRIEEHKRGRPSSWQTMEVPQNVSSVIKQEGKKTQVIILDCLTLLVANLVSENPASLKEAQVLGEVREIVKAYEENEANLIVVSNEVGMGIVPEFPLGRSYRDLLGLANQIIAQAASEVYLLVVGIPLKIK